jgi:hypothetical protein
MIDKIFPKYIQKSNFFLYPQLGFQRGIRYKPSETYVGIKDFIHPASCALICEYPRFDSNAFNNHLLRLKNHELYFDEHITDEYIYVVFNFSSMESDFMSFLIGEYSRFTEPFKQKILDFFSQGDAVTEYIESYLYPELYYDEYSKILNVAEKDLEIAIELCDKPDLKKETVTLQLNSKN